MGEDPFPLKMPLWLEDDETAARCEPGVAIYRADQIGPFVRVFAEGETTNSEEVIFTKTQLSLFPPEFALFFCEGDLGLPVVIPFKKHVEFLAEEKIYEVTVWDRDGIHLVKVEEAIE